MLSFVVPFEDGNCNWKPTANYGSSPKMSVAITIKILIVVIYNTQARGFTQSDSNVKVDS
jgi:hypothetical protein